ncbi:MAG: UDP-N-acetylmuramoyl-L-alanine--D-glutamate ligase [Candidatus Atribacteria bacterium]|nr:UDP-N-acetylmuramoyl-L-alanine--D-glutamate ligase [Candidatus Atribacteria bacterium]
MNVLIVGGRRSGVYASILAKTKGFNVFLTEKTVNDEVKSFEPLLKEYDIPYEFGRHSFEKFYNVDLVVLSPGVPKDVPIVKYLEEAGKKIVGELEFANMFAPDTEVIAITGTNGKSTTTALIGNIFKLFEPSTVVGGNLGTPYSELLLHNPNPKYAVLETSCFQLETIEQYHPKVSVFLNLTEDHLDRYKTMEEYFEAKKRIFMNQNETDFAVLNFDDVNLLELSKSLKPNVFFFSSKNLVEKGAFLYKDEVFFIKAKDKKPKKIIDRSNIRLPGLHNVENVLASITASMLLDVPVEIIKEGIETFKGLEHRLEFVRVLNGVTYVNDSKSTTPDSTIKALEAFNQKVILILGGSSKNNSFKKLAELFDLHVKFLILLGETADEIERAAKLAQFDKYAKVNSLREAVDFAKSIAKSGDIVLLSPACASFDMFKNFEDRGEKFKEIVNTL